MQVHHLGFLTDSIKEVFGEFSELGYAAKTEVVLDELRGINIQFIESASGEVIELIEPVNEKSVVSKLLNKFKNQIYHTCYQVINIEKAVGKLSEKGFMLIDPVKDAVAMNGKVAFLYGGSVGIIELYQPNNV